MGRRPLQKENAESVITWALPVVPFSCFPPNAVLIT